MRYAVAMKDVLAWNAEGALALEKERRRTWTAPARRV